MLSLPTEIVIIIAERSGYLASDMLRLTCIQLYNAIAQVIGIKIMGLDEVRNIAKYSYKAALISYRLIDKEYQEDDGGDATCVVCGFNCVSYACQRCGDITCDYCSEFICSFKDYCKVCAKCVELELVCCDICNMTPDYEVYTKCNVCGDAICYWCMTARRACPSHVIKVTADDILNAKPLKPKYELSYERKGVIVWSLDHITMCISATCAMLYGPKQDKPRVVLYDYIKIIPRYRTLPHPDSFPKSMSHDDKIIYGLMGVFYDAYRGRHSPSLFNQ